MSGSGTALSVASWATFILALGLVLFQSVAIGSFWAFINMLQMISFLPIIDCVIPSNFETFITQYLTVGDVSFPFDTFSEYIPNPLSYLSAFITNPLDSRYFQCGFESLSFIYNFGSQLVTWLLVGLFYLLIRILVRAFPRRALFRRWKAEYEFNAILRTLIECLLNMIFCALLNIWQVSYPITPMR